MSSPGPDFPLWERDSTISSSFSDTSLLYIELLPWGGGGIQPYVLVCQILGQNHSYRRRRDTNRTFQFVRYQSSCSSGAGERYNPYLSVCQILVQLFLWGRGEIQSISFSLSDTSLAAPLGQGRDTIHIFQFVRYQSFCSSGAGEGYNPYLSVCQILVQLLLWGRGEIQSISFSLSDTSGAAPMGQVRVYNPYLSVCQILVQLLLWDR